MRSRVWAVLFVVVGACSGSTAEPGEVGAPPAAGMGVAGAGADQVQAEQLAGMAGSAAPASPERSDDEAPAAEPTVDDAPDSADAAAAGSSSPAPAGAGSGGSSAPTVTAGTGGSSSAVTGGSAGSSMPSAGSGGTGGSVAPTPDPKCECMTLVSGQNALIGPHDWCYALAGDPPNASGYSATKTTGCRMQLEAQSQGVAAVRAFCCGDE